MQAAPPASVALIDQRTLLTAATLRLSREVRASKPYHDRQVIKYQPGRQYLVVSPAQWEVLQTFGAGRSVPDVLCELISDRRSLPLREFYELVVKAFHHGILQMDGQPVPPNESAFEWRAHAGGRLARWLAILAMAAAILTILLHPLRMPEHAGHLLLGWLLTCAATSAGYALAACVLRGAACEVYHPRLMWKTLVPHFRADLGDVIMGGRDAEIDAALVRIAPQFIFAAVVARYAPGLLFPLLCGIFFHISPLWPSPLASLLRALYHDPQLSTNYDFMFAQNQLFTVLLRARLKFADRKYLLVCAGYTLVWLFLVFLAGCALLHVNAFDLLRRFQAAGGLHFTALALLATFAAMAACTAGFFGWTLFRHGRDWLQERAERRRRPRAAPVAPDTIAALLARTLLFRSLPPDELATLATAMQAEEHPAGSYVVREGDAGDRLYVVYSGRVEVLRELSVGRPEPIAELREGDIFGEIALLQGGRRTRSVRSAEPSVLLALDKAAFASLVLSRFSRHAIEDAVQKVGFLQRIRLARQWSPYAMAAFARRATFQEFKEGDLIIQDGADNRFFYLIYEGRLAVMKQRKELAVLEPGDFFGELSLLQNSVATASIVARSPGRNLLMAKPEFLDFMTHDFLVGLQFEAISSRRLGQPLFPLKGRSFDVIRG
jgi:CRP-like cAMP-binding protein